jgi:hypothetical protein
MRSDGEDAKGERVRATLDQPEHFVFYFLFIFAPLFSTPLDGELNPGALDLS